MKMPNFTATSLRLTLSVSLFAITIITGVLFYFVDGQLKSVATEVSHTVVDANDSQNNVQTLQKIQRELENDKDIVAQANRIVADSQSYQYQDQIVSDLNRYASASSIKITNIDFSPATTTSPSTSGGKTQTTTPGTSAPTTPSGVKTTSVAVTMENPIGYSNFLQFLRSVEDNLTKMQVQRISLSKGTGNNDQVSSDVLTIQVYVR